MVSNNRYKATLTLAGAAAGFLVTYPWQTTFWGGLLNSGFGAAMVGGLADWYAVTALFRAPLAIPYRTAIIPKNRERIFSAIVLMVEEEIITAANIKETLQHVGIAKLALGYANRAETRQQLYALAAELGKAGTQAAASGRLAEALKLLLEEHQEKVKLAPLAGQALEWSMAKGYTDKLLDLVLTEIKRLADQPYLTELLAVTYSRALAAYAARQNQRKLAGWLLENLLKLDPMTVAGLMQDKILQLLEDLQQESHPLRLRMLGWLADCAQELQADTVLAAKAEAVLRPWLVKLVEQLSALPAAQPELVGSSVKWVVKQIVRLAEELADNAERQAGFDEYLVDALARWVGENHGQIGQLVQSYLDSFSNDQLVAYIEDKVMDDLQMIRINGSVVGGLAGMALFLVSYAAGVRL